MSGPYKPGITVLVIDTDAPSHVLPCVQIGKTLTIESDETIVWRRDVKKPDLYRLIAAAPRRTHLLQQVMVCPHGGLGYFPCDWVIPIEPTEEIIEEEVDRQAKKTTEMLDDFLASEEL